MANLTITATVTVLEVVATAIVVEPDVSVSLTPANLIVTAEVTE